MLEAATKIGVEGRPAVNSKALRHFSIPSDGTTSEEPIALFEACEIYPPSTDVPKHRTTVRDLPVGVKGTAARLGRTAAVSRARRTHGRGIGICMQTRSRNDLFVCTVCLQNTIVVGLSVVGLRTPEEFAQAIGDYGIPAQGDVQVDLHVLRGVQFTSPEMIPPNKFDAAYRRFLVSLHTHTRTAHTKADHTAKNKEG